MTQPLRHETGPIRSLYAHFEGYKVVCYSLWRPFDIYHRQNEVKLTEKSQF